MPLFTDWPLEITVDDVLIAQGADPAKMRARRPAIVQSAEWALEQGLPLIQPQVLVCEYRVARAAHNRLDLAGAAEAATTKVGAPDGRLYLSGELIGAQMAAAERVIVFACTIGGALEELSAAVLREDPVLGLALDGLGSAAVEQLSSLTAAHFEQAALAEGLKTSLPLSPGLEGWPLEAGQKQVQRLLSAEMAANPEFVLRFTASSQMLPQKSLSAVLGIGAEINAGGALCDLCAMRFTCRQRQAAT